MSENRENDPHTLEIILAAGPSLISIWPNLREADERCKAAEARREDWIRQRVDMFGSRLRFPRQFWTGARVYPATLAQLVEAKDRAATEAKAPTEAVVGKPLDKPADGGNGKAKEAPPIVEPPAEPPVKQIKTSPV